MKDLSPLVGRSRDWCYGVQDPMRPESGIATAKSVRLATLIDRGARKLVYTDDMGDDGLHSINVEMVGPGEPEGKTRASLLVNDAAHEGVAGLPSFEMFLEAMDNPAHEDHDRLRDWYGDSYKLEDIDERFARRAAAAIRRHAGKVAYREGRAQ